MDKEEYEVYFPTEGKTARILVNPAHGKQVAAMILCQENVDICVIRHKSSTGRTEIDMVAMLVYNDFKFLFPEKEM